MKLGFSDTSQKYPQIQNFIKIRPLGPKLFHAGRRTDKHDEANFCFAQFLNALEDDKERRVSIKWGKVYVLSFFKRELCTGRRVNY
jgi:hypothetical protein